MKHYENALQHVRDNHRWSDDEERVALERIGLYRCPIDIAYPSIADEISDLMEEYGDDNGLPEGWWLDYGDTDDVFYSL